MNHKESNSSHQQTEEDLRESERKYRDLADSLPQTVAEIDIAGNIIFTNLASFSMFGYTKEDFDKGLNIFQMIAAEQRERARENIQKFMRGQEHDHEEYIYTGVRKDGSRFPFTVYLTPVLHENKTVGFRIILIDVTERMRSEEALRATQMQLSEAMDLAHIVYWETDPIDDVFLFNDAFYALYGTTAEQEGGYRMTRQEFSKRFVHPDDLPRVSQFMEQNMQRLEDESIADIEHRIIRRDGEVRHILVRSRAVRDKSGRIIKRYGANQDITQRKQSEQEKARLESQLFQSQKMEAIGTLAGGIAHDFNNILTIISGFGLLLKRGMKKGDTKEAYIDQILTSSEKAAELTQGLLAFGRKQQISLKPLDINNTIKATSKLLKRLLTEDIELKTRLSKRNAIIMADPTQIDQILFNLATNARDVMPHGGTLIIETNVVELNDEFINAQGHGTPGEYAFLSITDTGSGIDEAIRERIFEPFFTTKEVGKGTGLGLATVYGIVNQHNGYIMVYSEPNIGTTFHIYFPIVNKMIREDEGSQPPVKGGDETILVAEDDEGVRLLISKVLNENGYTTIEAVDGVDAAEKFKTAPAVDLLIFDSVMPKKNGRETYDEIERNNPDTKVIFISGYARDVFLDKGIQDEKFNFLQKPISPRALLRKVREVLDDNGDYC